MRTNKEDYLSCLKILSVDENIKIALISVKGRDSENHTPTIDIEPKFCKTFFIR